MEGDIFLSFTLSPIAFFCYNRPNHTRITLEALQKNHLASQSKIFIILRRSKNDDAKEGVSAVRKYISSLDGFKSVEIVMREENYGCVKNIIDGITRIAGKFGRVIIVEEDILTCPHFLHYMNDALELYKDDDRVGAVTGYLYPLYANERLPQSFFSDRLAVWGWGTWQRSWKDYEYDAGKLLARLKSERLTEKYDFGLKSRPRTSELEAQKSGRINTWDYQVNASMFLHGRLTLNPGRTLTNNIGFDGSGVHCGTADNDAINISLATEYEPLTKIPAEIDSYLHEVYRQSLEYSGLHRWQKALWHLRRIFS